ncbi:hypothetical protein FQZ97_1028680 [compost metagenome]
MCREDGAVDGQQLGTFHAGTAGARADQQGVVGVLEGGHRVAVGFHAGQQREGAVVEFHHHALERLLGLLVGDFQQLQDHGLVFAQHFARGDAEQQGVTNLTCGTGDGNTNGLFAHGENSRKGRWINEKRTGRTPSPGPHETRVNPQTVNQAQPWSVPSQTLIGQFVLCLI